ncbi:hypothetical protein JYK22_06660, partial [Nonomuraea sp. RK-328]|nr:hypothetical protein [Nonomuraea sp. RK-328]
MMILDARAPFDFGASLRFLARFPPAAGEQEITGTTLVKAYRVAGHTVPARLFPAAGGLRCELESPPLPCPTRSSRPRPTGSGST